MGRRLLGFGIVLFLSAAPALAAEKWIHVRVVEDGGSGDTVRVNLPLSTIEALIPHVEAENLSGGKLRLTHDRTEAIDLRAMWKALRASGDADFVTVDGSEGTVRVSRAGNYLLAHVETRDDENVRVRVPITVLDALFSSGDEEIDLVAAIRALADHGDGEIVRVEDGDTQVRVWVDGVQDGR